MNAPIHSYNLSKSLPTNIHNLSDIELGVLLRYPHREATLPSYFGYLPQNLRPEALLDNLLRKAAPASRFVFLSRYLRLFDRKARP